MAGFFRLSFREHALEEVHLGLGLLFAKQAPHGGALCPFVRHEPCRRLLSNQAKKPRFRGAFLMRFGPTSANGRIGRFRLTLPSFDGGSLPCIHLRTLEHRAVIPGACAAAAIAHLDHASVRVTQGTTIFWRDCEAVSKRIRVDIASARHRRQVERLIGQCLCNIRPRRGT